MCLLHVSTWRSLQSSWFRPLTPVTRWWSGWCSTWQRGTRTYLSCPVSPGASTWCKAPTSMLSSCRSVRERITPTDDDDDNENASECPWIAMCSALDFVCFDAGRESVHVYGDAGSCGWCSPAHHYPGTRDGSRFTGTRCTYKTVQDRIIKGLIK